MPPNLVQLSECPMGVMSPVYVTDAERYQGVYSTVDKLRRSLVHNKHFRKPYLDLLKTLYTKKGRMSENIKHIPIKPPTDANIQDYFHDEWPEIRFVPDACHDIHREGFLWGYTNVGRASADENMIHVKLGLIRHWREMSETSHPAISTSELSLFFVMVVLHEIGHRVMVWWTRGWCRTPSFSPVCAEAGTFIEQCFIGNDVAGWWKSKVIGDFKNLKYIGIVRGGQSKLFDQRVSNQALEAMMDFDKRLPLLDLSHSSIRYQPTLSR